MSYGYFEHDSKFHITDPDIPRNWYNYLWNDRYITFVSQTGAGIGLLQDALGRRISFLQDRVLFLLEDGAHWGISGLPVEEEREEYFCTHALGYSVIHTQQRGISSDVTFFVPDKENCELWQVKVKNNSDRARKVNLWGYMGTGMDAPYVRQGYSLDMADWDDSLAGIVHQGFTDFDGKEGAKYYGYMTMTERAEGYSGAANAFIGPYGSFAYPQALRKGKLNNIGGGLEKLGFALSKELTLAPYEEKNVTFICGIAFSMEDAVALRTRLCTDGEVERELDFVKAKFLSQTDGVSLHTPDEGLNHMFTWLKQQANMGSRWARVRHNGYRDMTSDSECLASFNPTLALERFKRVLTYQYPNGYAPRTFLGGKIRDNNFSDNTVWLTFAASTIVKELGDKSVLDIPVAYNDGSVAPIYDHLKNSVEFLYNFRGLHGLIRIWGGDWNDCMNTAGLEGKGVSVWLSLAWVRAAKMFAELASIAGKHDDAACALERAREMSQIIETYGWEDDHYICAINDWEEKIGSWTCEEGKLFLIPQIWSVLSGVSELGREVVAMDTADKHLSSDMGTLISIPPYTKHNPHIGSVTAKLPGVQENGGVYLHTIAWKIAADAMLGRADRVAEDIETILPYRNKVTAGRAEPYILCNCYFGIDTGYRYGTPGQSWRTAAGPWFEKALIVYVFGLQAEMEGLTLRPCLPPNWETSGVTKSFRGAEYEITYVGGGAAIQTIEVDGVRIEGNVLPCENGRKYNVVVTMAK